MRPIDLIVIHCSASPNGRWNTVEDIDAWHRDRAFHRDAKAVARFNPRLPAIGYHYVIYTNGGLVTGRHLDEVGAHAEGFNAHSVGICLIGTDSFSEFQWNQLASQVRHVARELNVPVRTPEFKSPRPRGVCGHRELPGVIKTCPGFSVADWLARGMEAPAAHLLEVPR